MTRLAPAGHRDPFRRRACTPTTQRDAPWWEGAGARRGRLGPSLCAAAVIQMVVSVTNRRDSKVETQGAVTLMVSRKSTQAGRTPRGPRPAFAEIRHCSPSLTTTDTRPDVTVTLGPSLTAALQIFVVHSLYQHAYFTLLVGAALRNIEVPSESPRRPLCVAISTQSESSRRHPSRTTLPRHRPDTVANCGLVQTPMNVTPGVSVWGCNGDGVWYHRDAA